MRMNVWTAYRVGLRTKTGGDASRGAIFKQLAKNLHRPAKFSWTLRPMDFLRYREFDFALRKIETLPKLRRILDISSPKLLPLTLGSTVQPCEIFATDILAREVDWTRNKARQLDLKNIRCEVQDARKLTYPSNHFDLITSISVFEHIAPEVGGDLPAIGEVTRVLRSGGHAIITVPFSRTYFADYIDGHVYERAGSGERNFFQRFYTEDLIRKNFAEHGGLEIVESSFVDEQYFFRDPQRRVAHWINNSPRQTSFFGPMFPLLSHVFLSRPRPLEKCRKPYIACLLLRKPNHIQSMAA